jgi:hypothetical protein
MKICSHKKELKMEESMKKLVLLIAVLGAVFLGGCAGMSTQDQRNLGINAIIGAGIGATTGALIGAATGGDPATGAIIGGLAGAGAWALNTPTSGNGYGRDIDCSRFSTQRERAACEKGQNDTQSQIQAERERRAYNIGRGGYYPRYRY